VGQEEIISKLNELGTKIDWLGIDFDYSDLVDVLFEIRGLVAELFGVNPSCLTQKSGGGWE